MDLTTRPFEETIGERDLAHWKSPPGRLLARLVLHLARWTAWRWVTVGLVAAGAVLAFLGTALFGEVYEAVRRHGSIARIDQPALDWSMGHRPAWATTVATWFTQIGGPVVTPVLLLTTMVFLSWRWRTWTPIVLATLAGVGSLAMTIAGKMVVARHRPPLSEAVPPFEHSFSFPSGHAMNAVVVAGVIGYVSLTRVTKRSTIVLVAVLAAFYAVAMGLSRVYLGHHWLSDVVAGWILGATWLAVVVTAHRLHLTHHRYHQQLDEAEAALARGENPEERP